MATAARPDAPANLWHHTKDQRPGTRDEGQDRRGRRRGEEVQETPEMYRRDVENGGDSGGRRKNRRIREYCIGSIDVNLQHIENRNEAERGEQGA